MSKKKISILLAEPLDKHVERTSGGYYLKKYFDITFLICSDWVWNLNSKNFNYLQNASNTNCQFKIIKNLEDLKIELKSIGPDFVFDCIYNQFSDEFKKIVHNLNSKYVLINNGHIPSRDNKSFIWKFLTQLKNFFKSKKSSDIAILAGSQILKSYDLKKTKNICWIGSEDYYKYNQVKNRNKLKKSKYILYIDSAVFSKNNDFRFLKIKNIPTDQQIKNFYNNIFNKFENYFKMPVVVAGHRRGKLYKNYTDLFSGRKVIFDKTAELTEQSAFVISNFSTAISFAVLSLKPIIFFTNANFDKLVIAKFIYALSKELDAVVINDDKNCIINDKLLNINVEKYKLYEVNYIKNNMVTSNFPFHSFIKKYAK